MNEKKSAVLVTGATGFLGSHLVELLSNAGYQVAALVRDAATQLDAARVVVGSPLALPDPTTFGRLHTIIHTAATVSHSRNRPEAMLEINVDGTVNMVRFAASTGARLIVISSSGTVGCFREADSVADENAPYATSITRRWPYYASKIEAELRAETLAKELGVELVIVRPPVLLGPGDHRVRSTKYVHSLMRGHVPVIPRGGMHFTDVRDVAQAIRQICGIDRPRKIYHLPGNAMSLAAFFEMVSELSGAKLPRLSPPAWTLKTATKVANGVASMFGKRPPSWIPDPVVAEMAACHWGLATLWSTKELNYQPRSAQETLLDTITWLREYERQMTAEQAVLNAALIEQI